MNTHELIPIEPGPKAGSARAVEEAVQDITAGASIDGRLTSLRDSFAYSGKDVEARYAAAKRMRQAVYGVACLAIARVAFPRMLEQLEDTGSLAIPYELAYDPQEYIQLDDTDHGETYRQAVRSAYWLTDSGEAVLDEIQYHKTHPLHPLHAWTEKAGEEYCAAWEPWHRGSGRNRWPSALDPEVHGRPRAVLRSLALNVGSGINLCAAKAVHHLIHQNAEAGVAELDRVSKEAVPRTLWAATTDRHLSWTPGWRQVRERGEPISLLPGDGMLALLQRPTTAITQPNRFEASVEGIAMMRDAGFCPHRIVRDGPIAKAAACAGDIWGKHLDEAGAGLATTFFERNGFRLADGSFNMAAVAMVMGTNTLRTIVLPAYMANRAAEAAAT
jgi:hypothetical protein